MRRVGLWWAPLLLLAAPLVGRAPLHRDLVDYFAPMRSFTSACLRSGVVPWLNPGNGCGEVWFANPQTGVLYPPHWIHLVLPLTWGLTFEVAFHLALLSLGVGLLAGRCGADGWGRSAAEVAAWSAGPVLATVGVLNNLEALAWLPWMALAAGREDRRVVVLTAPTVALAWLAGEPQVWAIGVVLAVAAARRRLAAVAGVLLGVGLVAVQLLPFLLWVGEGDRGPGSAAAALTGAVPPAAWWGLLLPGVPAAVGDGMVYAESLLLGPMLLACALIGLHRRWWALAAILALAGLATLPAVGGGVLYLALTRGLVRYPARFALVAAVCLLPLAGVGVSRWRARTGGGVVAVVAVLALIGCVAIGSPWSWVVTGVPAGVALLAAVVPGRAWLRDAAVVAGLAGIAIAGLPLLGLEPTIGVAVNGPTWPEARSGGRLYTPPLTAERAGWLATGVMPRRLWLVGYLNLEEGVESVRTWGPLGHRRLAEHLARADQGPEARWWLDTLAASWVVLPYRAAPAGMVAVRRHGNLWLFRNRSALPEVSLAAAPPDGRRPWTGVGAIVTLIRGATGVSATTSCARPGWAWISLSPLVGWHWWLDGRRVEPEQGPGIVQVVPVPAGAHRLVGAYRPPALALAGCASLAALAALGLLLWMGRSGERAAWR